MLKRIASSLLILLCLPLIATGEIIHVPLDQPTIQAGIDAALDGDTVLVADGTYSGIGNTDISFSGKSITLRSENGPAACIIDCEDGSQPGVNFHWFDGPDTLLEGFTVENSSGAGIFFDGGLATVSGCVIQGNLNGGIYLILADPTITGCTVTGNFTSGHGGGICCWDSSPVIEDCTITGNWASDDYGGFGEGGGIYVTFGAPVIVNNIISDNLAESFGGGISGSQNHDAGTGRGGVAIISGNRITGNYGGGIIWMDTAEVELTNNLISGNTDGYYSPYSFGVELWDSATIANCTIADNEGYELTCFGGSTAVTVADSIIWGTSPVEIRLDYNGDLSISYSDVSGGQSAVSVGSGSTLDWGPGMIDVNPKFVNGTLGDHYLAHLATGQLVNSPCVDAGSGTASATCYTNGTGFVCMGDASTRTDSVADTGQVDMGYHYPGLPTVDASLICIPAAGTLPFSSAMTATLTNQYTGQIRRIAGRIDVTLASGAFIGSWRAGYTNVAAGGSQVSAWPQNIPALGFLIGDNRFELISEDVTPAPYNQPPYPPAGDTATSSCTVTGTAP